MAISFRSQEASEDAPIAQINTTPLVDVMLVLLIIFLITVPVVNSSVLVNLPREPNQAREARPDTVVVTVDAQGTIFWNDARVPSPQWLQDSLNQAAAQQPQPELHIRGDASAEYDGIGQVVFAAQQAGLQRVGFVTEPPERR